MVQLQGRFAGFSISRESGEFVAGMIAVDEAKGAIFVTPANDVIGVTFDETIEYKNFVLKEDCLYRLVLKFDTVMRRIAGVNSYILKPTLLSIADVPNTTED